MQGTIRHNYQAEPSSKPPGCPLQKALCIDVLPLASRVPFVFKVFKYAETNLSMSARLASGTIRAKILGDCQAIRLRFRKHVLKHHLIWRGDYCARALARIVSHGCDFQGFDPGASHLASSTRKISSRILRT